MNIIKEKLIDYIKCNSEGIPLDQFIEICLFENNGYYRNNQPIGICADFITAPEISQLFGEILGLYIYELWKKHLLCKFNLIELGPGKGTLLEDILRINNNFKLFLNSIDLNLIEINKELIKLQKKNLSKIKFDINNIQWSNDIDSIELKPSIIFANEFFDCFAIKQFIKINQKWHEKKINFNNEENRFFINNIIVNNIFLSEELDKIAYQNGCDENQIVEISNSRKDYFNKICNFIRKNDGIAIIVDYGYLSPINYSTLQSVSLHSSTNILDNPGNQDITSLVNFNDLIEIAKKNYLNIYGPITQQEFLKRNGIKERKKKILIKASERQKIIIEKGYERLIAQDQMGTAFKFLVVSTYKLSNEQ
jgi:SAM-dependent MidA family methyltransferase